MVVFKLENSNIQIEKRLKLANLKKEKTSYLYFGIISICIFAFFAILAVFFPYSGDDWAWGSSIGIDRLKTFFDNYNGRYFGNFVILAITRSKILKVLAMAFSYYATCFLCYKYSGLKKNTSLLFSFILFLLMSRSIFMQSVVWSSGYANYVPSALISVLYLVIIKNITGNEMPKYPKFLFLITFVMGFVGAPFIENIALFNICLAVAVIGYTLLKFKKVYLTHISFFVGSVVGALWMFSNSAYSAISAGEDGYRTTPKTLAGIIELLKDNVDVIFKNVVTDNYLICCVVTVLLLVLTIKFIKNSKDKSKNIFAVGSMTINAISLILIIAMNSKALSPIVEDSFTFFKAKKFTAIVSMIFALSILAVVLICVEKGRKFSMLLPFYCIPVSVAPLLVVTPIGPRCFYVSYFLTMVFAVDLFCYISKDWKISEFNYKAMFFALAVVAVVLVIFYIGVFAPIYHYDSTRNEFAKLQSDNGEENIVIAWLPNTEYLWTANPKSEPWITRYKLFYGINQDAELDVRTTKNFDEYYENYKK